MQITRINKIRNYRIFRDFTWPSTLPDFARYNLIYGWNGSGKTTLSNLLRDLQRRANLTTGEAEFTVGGMSCHSSTFGTAPNLPNVRVFNREYVEATVFKPGNSVDPIFVLGQDSIEKQKKVEALKSYKESLEKQLSVHSQRKQNAVNDEDKFTSSNAVIIKNLIGEDSTSLYRNYDKSRFREKAISLLKANPQSPASISNETRRDLILRQQEKPRETIPSVALSVTNFAQLYNEATDLLRTTVAARVIDNLVAHPKISAWVEKGLELHKNHNDKCLFCDESIRRERLADLEAHFNSEDRSLKAKLATCISKIGSEVEVLSKYHPPDKAVVYADLQSAFQNARAALESAITEHRQRLLELGKRVESKRDRSFESVLLPSLEEHISADPLKVAVDAINSVIAKHNSETDNFRTRVVTARRTLEEHTVAGCLEEYRKHRERIKEAGDKCNELAKEISELGKAISKLELEISAHVRPAQELNRELRSYLGRNEIVLKAEKNGYSITRDGFPATHLSEGEKTAIAFLYFLKSLVAKEFDLATGIVVVDDPVSSLDSNALFYAFGFLKERTKDAGQLIVLTHNFSFFALVRKWFGFFPKPDRRFYMLESRLTGPHRGAVIAPLDASLEKFHSEYHFLFFKIYTEANADNIPGEMVNLYPLPNIARRFLETFLAFRRPGIALDQDAINLHEKLVDVAPTIDGEKKVRILRFVHTFSHANKVPDEEHDLFLLSEGREVLRFVLELVQEEDPEHYKGMLKAIGVTLPGIQR